MSLCASYIAAPLVAVRLNYKSVTKSCVVTDHFNQSNFHFTICNCSCGKVMIVLDEHFS